MNKELISGALSDIDESFIVEAREDSVKFAAKKRTRIIVSAVSACACAVALCVGLPIAFSRPQSPVVPSQVGTVKPDDPSVGGDTPPVTDNDPPKNPSDNNPPITGTDAPPSTGNENDTPYFEYGYAFSGMTEPISPFMIAYKIDREFDRNADEVSVTLSFGEWGHGDADRWIMTNVVVSVYDPYTKQSYELKNLTAAEFAADEYDVKVKCTYEENEYGEPVTTSETRTFGHTESFTFPSEMFGREYGTLVFNILVFDGDEYVSGGGVDICYAKTDEKIKIITYREYKEIEASHQTPPKTDVIVKPAE